MPDSKRHDLRLKVKLDGCLNQARSVCAYHAAEIWIVDLTVKRGWAVGLPERSGSEGTEVSGEVMPSTVRVP
jgi:hypothetical protein